MESQAQVDVFFVVQAVQAVSGVQAVQVSRENLTLRKYEMKCMGIGVNKKHIYGRERAGLVSTLVIQRRKC